jgi:hypothetical protein
MLILTEAEYQAASRRFCGMPPLGVGGFLPGVESFPPGKRLKIPYARW